MSKARTPPANDEPEDPVEAGALHGPLVEHRDLDAGLAQLPPGNLDRFLGLGLGVQRRGRAQARRGGKRTGLEERAAIGIRAVALGHVCRLRER